MRALLERIAAAEAGPDGLNAFISLEDPDRWAESDLSPGAAEGALGGLEGVPVAVKDNLTTLALPTTCASRVLEGFRAPYEATAVRRLRDAGARVVGKTNMDEFAMGASTENSAFGPTRNPRALGRVPGGSSGGSAAAVAAGYVPLALGSDTGGSVRQPAAFCGVVGLKPTYGRVSRYGLVAFASSLDQVGPIADTVERAARCLEVIAGADPRDATCSRRPVPRYTEAVRRGAKGLVVGVPEEYFGEGLDGAVGEGLEEARGALEDAGATFRSVRLRHTELAIPTYYVLAPAEASSNLARFDGVRYGPREEAGDLHSMVERTRSRFGAEVKRRIVLGTYVLSAGYYDAYYARAQRARAVIARDFEEVFREVDVLWTPTTPTPAFELGARTDDPLAMYLSDVYTVTANLAGIPAISVPAGEAQGLPVGAQILAPWWEEETLLQAAAALEAALAGERDAP